MHFPSMTNLHLRVGILLLYERNNLSYVITGRFLGPVIHGGYG